MKKIYELKSLFAIFLKALCLCFISCESRIPENDQLNLNDISVIEEIASLQVFVGESYLLQIEDPVRRKSLVEKWMAHYFAYWYQTTYRDFPRSAKFERTIAAFIEYYVVNPGDRDPKLAGIVTESFEKPFEPAEIMLKHGSNQHEPLLIWGYEVSWDDYPKLVDEFREYFINFSH